MLKNLNIGDKKDFCKVLQGEIAEPQISRRFLENKLIMQVLCSTIEDFNFEEKATIYLYCIIDMPVEEITKMTSLSEIHVLSTLIMYFERLTFKLKVFEKALGESSDKISVGELLLKIGV